MPGLALLFLQILPIDFSYIFAKFLISLYFMIYPENLKSAKERIRKIGIKKVSTKKYIDSIAKNLTIMLHYKNFRLESNNLYLKKFIGVSFHFGLWELIPLFFKRYNNAILVSKYRSKFLEKFLSWRREKIGGVYVSSLQELLGFIKRGWNVGCMLEGSIKSKKIFTDVPYSDYTHNKIPYVLSKRYKLPIVFLFAVWDFRRITLKIAWNAKEAGEIIKKKPLEWIAWVN